MERRAETEGRQRDDAEMCGIRQDRGSRGEEKGRWDDARGTALSSFFLFFLLPGQVGTADIFATFQMGALTNYGGDLLNSPAGKERVINDIRKQ